MGPRIASIATLKRRFAWFLVLLITGVVALGMVYLGSPRSYTYDPRLEERNPSIVTRDPREIIDELNMRAGGLPKSDIRLEEMEGTLPPTVRFFPVRRYTITQVRISAEEPLWLALFTERPTYQYTITLVAEYEDRDARQIAIRITRPGLFTGFSIRRSLFTA